MLSSFINQNTSRLLLFFICFFVTFPIYGQRTLPEEIELLANKHNIPIDSLSIILQPLNSDTRLINLNAEVHRTPASVAKLFTAFVAIDHLGPDYHWPQKYLAQTASTMEWLIHWFLKVVVIPI